MVSTQQLQGNWNTIRGKVKEKWGQLTDDDLRTASGNVDQLIGAIQRKTGEARQSIENFLSSLTQQPAFERAKEAVSEYTDAAAEKVREGYEEVTSRVKAGYKMAEETIQGHPAASVATVFAAGVITGLVLGLVLSK